MDNKALLPVLLGYVLRGEKVPQELIPQDWNEMMALANRHKVLCTLACVLPLLPERPDGEICKVFEATVMEQMLVSSNQLYAVQQMQACFESRELYNMVLKGVQTKRYYPQDYMRSMNDMDVLCKPEQNSAVKEAMESLGYGDYRPGRKHDHYYYPPYLMVEVHRELVAARSEFSGYYEDIWQRCQPISGKRYSYEMSVEDGYVFSLVHLAEHYREGGAGIRFFMDVYVYETMVAMDRQYIAEQMKKLQLQAFYTNAVKLAMHWFGGEDGDALTERMAEFVLSGGLYGSVKTARANSVSKGGRLRFLMSACFPGFREMRSMYPWLDKCPVALPVAWGMRGVGSILYRKKNIRSQFQAYAKGDKNHGRMLQEFYRDCGL